VAIIISAALVVLYTYFGGMYSVATLDTIQSLVIVVGLSVISFFLVSEVGGFSSLIQGTPESYFTFTPGSSGNLTEWLVFLTALMTAAFGGVPQQDVYQRAMSAKSVKVSMWASITGGFVYLIIVMLPISIVASARILYPEIAATDVENLLMRTIQEHTPIVLQVLFFGALISAIVSTASGALLAPGTLLAENVVKPFYKNIGDALRLRIIRIALLVIAIIGTSLALKDDARIYDLVSSAYSVTLVAAFIPITFGLYTKWVNAFGAFFSVSAGIMFWQAAERIGTEVPPTFIGFCASFVAIIIGSYVGNLIEKNKDISL
jgi:Na+/proline symporter